MQKFQLNFLPRKDNALSLGQSVFVLGLLCLFACYVIYDKKNKQLIAIQDQLTQPRADSHQKALKIPPTHLEELAHKKELQSSMQKAIDTPWDKLFSALESSDRRNIQLLEILPETDKGKIRILAKAQQLNEILDYVEVLKKQPTLQDVTLIEHQTIPSDNQVTIQFTIEASWLIL